MNRKFWIKFIAVFLISIFSYPSLYLFGLSNLWDGLLLYIINGWIIFLLVIVYFYPFVRAILFINNKQMYFGVLSVLGGIVMPFFSGVIGIFVVEIFRKHEANSNGFATASNQ